MKNFLYASVLLGCLTAQSGFAQNNTDYARKMAETVMKTYPDSMVVMRYTTIADPDAKIDDNKRPAKWNYEMGVVFMGFERLWRATGDIRYFRYIQKIIDHLVKEDGTIPTYKLEEYSVDNIPTGRQLLTIYQTQNDARYKKAADLIRNQIAWQPRNKAGGFWHKLIYPTQMWLDGLYMVEPFYAEYAQMSGNDRDFDDIAYQFILMEQKARDPKTGLLYHGWDESRLQGWASKETGRSPEFWSRAMGWYLMGLVDVLDYFPQQHPKRKELIAIINRLSSSLVKVQDPASGVWWQVTDKGGKPGNYLEASSSSMFVYGMAKAIRMGYLSKSYLPQVKKGFDGIIRNFVETDAQGNVHLTKAVGGAGLGGTPYRDGSYEYYIREPYRTDDLKAIGPFMQACVEVDMLNNLSFGMGKTVLLDNYFNNEKRNNLPFHYTWTDRFDSGYSWLGGIFRDYGGSTAVLTTEPTSANLKKASVYIIADPDTKKETKNPHFVEARHIKALKDWVTAGGVLVLLANDTANSEQKHFNQLTSTFGIQLSGQNRNMVKNDVFEQGRIDIQPGNPVFTRVDKVFIKELVTLKTRRPAVPLVTAGSDVIMATARIGKGTVFVLGDPWIYNEYLNGRRIPAEYQNYEAAKDLVGWLLTKSARR